MFVFATGVIAWWISSGIEKDDEPSKTPDEAARWEIQVLGWTSAVLYVSKPVLSCLSHLIQSRETVRGKDTANP